MENMPTKYEKLEKLSNGAFKRATGVKRKTFLVMINEVEKAENIRKMKSKGRGRKSTLCLEDQILMTLEYLREYRTQFHIAVDYEIAESGVCRTSQRIENILIKCNKFHLPGKKEFQKTDVEFEVVLVDATESQIERPKKSNDASIAEKRRNTQ